MQGSRVLPGQGKVEYLAGGDELLDRVRPLWEQLNHHHQQKSRHFQEWFATRTFDQRVADLREKAAEGRMRIDLALASQGEDVIGYCVSTIDRHGAGEVDSLLVDPAWRGNGIALRLMQMPVDWLRDSNASPIRLVVAEGNEDVISFYRRFDFHPRHYTLQDQGDAPLQAPPPGILLRDGSLELLPGIELLWNEVREHHARSSPMFADHFRGMTFDGEKLALMAAHRGGGVRIDVAYARQTPERAVGYGIAAFSRNGTGVIESLGVAQDMRGKGLGLAITTRQAAWLREKCSGTRRVDVAVGNEAALSVYQRAGFALRHHVLEWLEGA